MGHAQCSTCCRRSACLPACLPALVAWPATAAGGAGAAAQPAGVAAQPPAGAGRDRRDALPQRGGRQQGIHPVRAALQVSLAWLGPWLLCHGLRLPVWMAAVSGRRLQTGAEQREPLTGPPLHLRRHPGLGCPPRYAGPSPTPSPSGALPLNPATSRSRRTARGSATSSCSRQVGDTSGRYVWAHAHTHTHTPTTATTTTSTPLRSPLTRTTPVPPLHPQSRRHRAA